MSNDKSRRLNEKIEFGLGIPGVPNAEQRIGAFRQQIQVALDLSDAAPGLIMRFQVLPCAVFGTVRGADGHADRYAFRGAD